MVDDRLALLREFYFGYRIIQCEIIINDFFKLPGLVFPNMANSKSEMVCNGVLPIDQMRDHVGPMSYLIQHIPRIVIELVYGIRLPQPDITEGDRFKSNQLFMVLFLWCALGTVQCLKDTCVFCGIKQ